MMSIFFDKRHEKGAYSDEWYNMAKQFSFMGPFVHLAHEKSSSVRHPDRAP